MREMATIATMAEYLTIDLLLMMVNAARSGSILDEALHNNKFCRYFRTCSRKAA